MRRFGRYLVRILLGLLFLLLVLAGVLVLVNRNRPQQSANPARLSAAEKARVAEVIQLRTTLGDRVWPGWGSAEIPLIIYNEAYAFLLNYAGTPPAGWISVPSLAVQGGAWERVADDTFDGQPYYRQTLTQAETPSAFTMRVGERWVAGMTTYEWTRIGLANTIADQLPQFVRPLFPYTLFVNQLVNSSDHYIALAQHESLHAFQGIRAAEQLLAAERAVAEYEAAYPWEDAQFVADWQSELDLLQQALQAGDPAEQAGLAARFLAQRDLRRRTAALTPGQIRYEQQREWVEGVAKYTELAIWQAAALADGYQPVAGMSADADFDNYARFERQWRRERDQLVRMAGDDGDGRFYYSGWVQAVLLDALAPDWKTAYLSEDVTLEALLRRALD